MYFLYYGMVVSYVPDTLCLGGMRISLFRLLLEAVLISTVIKAL